MKKTNNIKTIILSLILGVAIFFVIDWVYYMNFISGDVKTVTFLLGGTVLLISALYLLLNETDKRTIQSIDYKDNFFGKIQKAWGKFLKRSSRHLVIISVVIMILSRFV